MTAKGHSDSQAAAFNSHQDWWEVANRRELEAMAFYPGTDLDFIRAACASAWQAGVDWQKTQTAKDAGRVK